MKVKYISISEFDRKNKIATSTISKAINSGRITAIKRGANGRVSGIDSKKALQEFKIRTDQSQAIKTKKNNPLKTKDRSGKVIVFQDERARREQFSAKTAELEYLKMAGELVSVEDVRREIGEIFTRLKNNVFGIATKKSAVIASESDPLRVKRIIRVEMTEVFNESSNELSESTTIGIKKR